MVVPSQNLVGPVILDESLGAEIGVILKSLSRVSAGGAGGWDNAAGAGGDYVGRLGRGRAAGEGQVEAHDQKRHVDLEPDGSGSAARIPMVQPAHPPLAMQPP